MCQWACIRGGVPVSVGCPESLHCLEFQYLCAVIHKRSMNPSRAPVWSRGGGRGGAGGAVSDRETLEYKDDRRCEYTGRSPNSGVLIALAGTDWRQDRCEAKGNRVIVFCFQEARGASWILFSNSASPCRGKADITSVSCTFVLYCFCLYSQKYLFLCPVIDVCVFFNPLCLLR